MTRFFGSFGPALICVVLVLAGVLDYLVDCTAPARSTRDAGALSLASESGPLYRYLTSHAQDGRGASFCDASEPEHNTALSQVPAQGDGPAAAGGEWILQPEMWHERKSWATRPVPLHVWLVPPEPPPQGKTERVPETPEMPVPGSHWL